MKRNLIIPVILSIFALICIVCTLLLNRMINLTQATATYELENQKAYYLGRSALNAAVWKLENYDPDNGYSPIIDGVINDLYKKEIVSQEAICDGGIYKVGLKHKNDKIIITAYATFGTGQSTQQSTMSIQQTSEGKIQLVNEDAIITTD